MPLKTNRKVLSGLAMASSLAWMSIVPAAAVIAHGAPTVAPGSVTLSGPIRPTNGSATFTASASDPNGTPEYQFWVQGPNGQWRDMQNYSTSNTFTLATPSQGDYLVAVEVMDQGEVQAGDWSMAQTTLPDGVFNGSAVSVASSASGSVAKGTAVTLTAAASGIFQALYQFWYQSPDGAWHQSGAYQSSNTFTFTPGMSGTYRYVAYAKSPAAANSQHGALESNVGSQVAFGTASQVVASPTSQTVVADGHAQGSVTFTVEDSHGNRVANFNGTLAVSDSHMGLKVTGSATVTDGQAAVAFSVPSADGGSAVSVTADHLTSAASGTGGAASQAQVANITYSQATATVSAAVPSAASLMLAATPTGLANNAGNSASIDVSLANQAGDGYVSASHTYFAELTITGPGSFSSSSAETTEVAALSAGVSSVSAAVYTSAGASGTITVAATPISGDPLAAASPVSIALYEAGAANHLAISSSMALGSDGLTYTTYTVAVEDQAGHVITTGSGSGVNASTLAVSTPSGNLEFYSASTPAGSEHAQGLTGVPIINGMGTFTVENTTYQSSPATLTVTDSNPAIASATARYTYLVGAPGYATAMPSGGTVAYMNLLRGQADVIFGQLTDIHGNPVAEAGQPIWFTLQDASGVLALPNHASSIGDTYVAYTNAAGVATITATMLANAPLHVDASVTVSGKLGAYPSGSEGPDTWAISPTNYTTKLSTTLPGGTVGGGATLPVAMVEGLNAEGSPVGGLHAQDLIDVTSSNPSVLSVGTAQIALNTSGAAEVTGITALSTGTAAITLTDMSDPNVPPLQVTYTVVPGSAGVFPLIEEGGQVLSSTSEVSVPASGLAEVQVVNADGANNPVPVTGTANMSVLLPILPSGLYWEARPGDMAAQSGVTAVIPAGQTSANVWIVSNGTATTYGGGQEAAFGLNASTVSTPTMDQFFPATASAGFINLGVDLSPTQAQDLKAVVSASATDVTTNTPLQSFEWISSASAAWATFTFTNTAIKRTDTFVYQFAISLASSQYGDGTFELPTLTITGS